VELASFILDIAGGSIGSGANWIRVSIVEDLRSDQLTLQMIDNGRGMSRREIRRALSRPESSYHRLAELAELCSGWLHLDSKPGRGTALTVTFKHSHIDRPPLGDMARALMTLLSMIGGGTLVYTHKVILRRGEEEFKLNTSELREQLDGVPIDHPGVKRWLAKRIGEEEKRLERLVREEGR